MFIIIPLLLASAALTLGAPAAVPGRLQTRKEGDQSEPFTIQVDCSGAEEVCNADCESILCLGAPNPVQRDKLRSSQGHRADAGMTIFKKTEKFRKEHGVDVSDDTLAHTGNSGEETVMALNTQGGKGEIVIPVHSKANSQLGSRIQGQLSHSKVGAGQWYYKRFHSFGSLAPYCAALETGSPSAEEICTRKGKEKTDPAWTAVTRDWSKPHPNNQFQYHMMDPDLPGDKWQAGGWGAGSSQKSKKDTYATERLEEREQEQEQTQQDPTAID